MSNGVPIDLPSDAAYVAGIEKLVELLEEMPGAASVSKTVDQEQRVRRLTKAIRSYDPTVLTFRKPRLKVHAFLSNHYPKDADLAMERINRLFD